MKFGLRIKGHKKEVDSFTAGTQTRTSRARESSVTHKSAITYHAVEEYHVIDWNKAKVVDREAQRQTRWIKDQEDTDVHESGCRILPTQPHMGPGFPGHVLHRAVNNQDVIKMMSDGHRKVVIRQHTSVV